MGSWYHRDQRRQGGAPIAHPWKANPYPSLSWNRATAHKFHWGWCCSYLHQLSRGQGQVPSAPAALLKPEESKGNSDSCCRIIWAKQAGEEKPGVFSEAVVPALGKPACPWDGHRWCSRSKGGLDSQEGEDARICPTGKGVLEGVVQLTSKIHEKHVFYIRTVVSYYFSTLCSLCVQELQVIQKRHRYWYSPT